MSVESWYVRDRNKISGPFDRAQLDALRRRGQLARFHQVSQDRQTWVSASSVPNLFPASGSPGDGGHAPGGGHSAAAPAGPEWYYSTGGSPSGPIGVQALLDLASHGAVTSDTLVWTKGFPAWVPFRDSGLVPPARGAAKPAFSGLADINTSPARSEPAAPAHGVLAYGLTYWLSFICTAFGVGLVFGGTISAMMSSLQREDTAAGTTVASTGFILLFIGGGCGIASLILELMILHRTWTLIQPLRQIDPTEAGMPTPGIAIGLLFLPIFNLYWLFIAYYGLAVRTNKYLARRMPDVPLMKEGLGLAFCLLFIYSPLLLTCLFLVFVRYFYIVEVTRICNELESRRASSQVSGA